MPAELPQSLKAINQQLREKGKQQRGMDYYQRRLDRGGFASLRKKPSYPFILNGVDLGTFEAELEVVHRNGRREAVIFRPLKSPEEDMVKKLMKAFYGISVTVRKP
jgi:hypothetical protein